MAIASRLPTCLLAAVLASAALSAQVDPGAAGGAKPPTDKPAGDAPPAAGDPAKGKPAEGAAAKPADPAAAIPISKLAFDKSELPAGLTLGKDVCCISEGAAKYFEDPGADAPKIPAPVNKSGQCFQKGNKTVGSVLVFEFADQLSQEAGQALALKIWGPKGRDEEHPEDLFSAGRYVVIFSFAIGDERAAWFREQIGARLGTPVPRDWIEFRELIDESKVKWAHGDPKGALKMLKEKSSKLNDFAYAQALIGDCAVAAEEWKTAVTALRRAIELHESGADTLQGDDLIWNSFDRLGFALLQAGKDDEAVPAMERAVALSDKVAPQRRSNSLYNYACALARVKRFDDCYTALEESIEIVPDYASMALEDKDLSAAVKRPEFKKLLNP